MNRRSGDGFVRCGDGRVRWGVFGAAGVVFVAYVDAVPLVMLQLRSAFAHEGGTWSCAGGALEQGESALEGALREASEEVGDHPGAAVLLGEFVFTPAPDWTYTTVVVEVAHMFGESLNFETDAVDWVHLDEVMHRPLHSGFAAAWPHVRGIIEAAERV